MLTPTGYSHTQQPIWPTAHTAHTASTAATPHYPQPGRRQTPADAPTPLKRSMLTPFGGPRPRFGAKTLRERTLVHPFKQTALIKKKKKKKKSAHIIVPGWLWRPGLAAAAALPDVGGSGGWLCQYPVAPTASVAVVARLVGMFATVMGVLSY